jgi:catechol 2,3-dioxygenase-like lactoylglutathione lyase family enzyme
MIWVDDVEATIRYYKTVLGFAESKFEPGWQWGWVRKDNIEIMFAKPNEHTSYSGPIFIGSFYFNVNNADEWYEYLKDKAHIYYPIENFEYGMREFAIKDCNGYILQFGQNIDDEK